MKLRDVFVFLLIVAILITGCGKGERIEGKVQDIFGNPLKDVTVKIQTSTFSSITDESGSYSLDYVPGSMKLIFSKEGYTTRNLDLNIQQKTYFPAETFTLCPIPQETGIFYIDTSNKRLVKLEENGKIEREVVSGWDNRTRITVRFSKPFITIKPGKALFIDTVPNKIRLGLTTVKENGLIYEGTWDYMEKNDKYSGFLQVSASSVGNENLPIGTVELSPGTYAWVKIDPFPRENETAFGFQVEDITAKESKSFSDDSNRESKEASPQQQNKIINTQNVAPVIDKADAIADVNGQPTEDSAHQQPKSPNPSESNRAVTRVPLKPLDQEVKVQTEDQLKIQTPPINLTAKTFSPSFDCAKASTNSEHLICTDANLAAVDVEMAQIYKKVFENANNKKFLMRDQNQWRKNYRDVCKDVACMLNAYAVRTKQLNQQEE